MATKDEDSFGCIGLIIGIVLIIALCKLEQYLETLEIVQTIFKYLMMGLFGIALLAVLIYFIPQIVSEVRLSGPKEFTVRCHRMEQGIPPIFLVVYVSSHNLRLLADQPSSKRPFVPAENIENFHWINGGIPSPVALPKGYTSLFYRFSPQAGDLTAETDRTGSPPAYHENERFLIVLAYSAVSRWTSEEPPQTLEQPLRISLVVVDRSGRERPRATRELYTRIQFFLQTQEPMDEDDDSWMYRSRPIFPW